MKFSRWKKVLIILIPLVVIVGGLFAFCKFPTKEPEEPGTEVVHILEAPPGQLFDRHGNPLEGTLKDRLEPAFEEWMQPVEGTETVMVDAEGNIMEVVSRQEAIPGEDLFLTIDSGLQARLQEQFGETKGASLIMNPKTGEILALIGSFERRYEPGEMMTVLTAALGIDRGVDTDTEDVLNALTNSDREFFQNIALQFGTRSFSQELRRIGFEQNIPFELPLNPSGISNTGEIGNDAQLIQSSMGQGSIRMNPIHMALLYASFLNEGDILQPRLVLEDPSIPLEPSLWMGQAFSPWTADTMKADLVQLGGMTGAATRIQSDSPEEIRSIQLSWSIRSQTDENTENPLLFLSMVEDVQE